MAARNDRVRIWDLPVRLFHWTLVVLLAVSYFSGRAGEPWMKLHFWSGYAILTLLVFRIVWGFVGSTTARFADFVRGPAAALRYLAGLPSNRPSLEVGHNPVGGLMVVVLLLAVLAQAAAGLFAADTDTGMINGPLANLIADKWVDRVTGFHKFWINVLLLLVALHVAAALFYLVWKRQNLIRAMIVGTKPRAEVVAPGGREPALRFASGRLALSVIVAAAALVYFIVRAGG